MNPLLSMQQNRPAPSVSSENGVELTSGDGAGGRRDRPLRAPRDTSCGTNVSTLRDSDSLFGTSSTFSLVSDGAPGRIRTCDARFRKPMLYPLSYEGLRLRS